ncbi:MAG: site-2 protease family protein [Clostridia bacterium]|nr:site-2 protease family protein [Clostridia bacterium]
MIFTHEFGHFITARIFKVTVNEFSIGMGPRIFSKTSKKTGIKYSLAALPIGGFVAMAGEDGLDPDPLVAYDPNSFDKKPAWQRFIITFAGAFVNIILGIIAMIILTTTIKIGNTEVVEFVPTEESGYEISSESSGIMAGDVITRIDGKRVRILDQLSYEIMRRGHEPVDVTVIRGGEEITVRDVVFPTISDQGQSFGAMDFRVRAVKKDFGSVMRYAFSKSTLIIRMCWESLYDLFTGRYTIAAVSGPVGMSSAIGEAAREGIQTLLYLLALISINLGVMNLLPIPALDGGRLLTILIEMITRRKLPAKVEGMINAVGLTLLLSFSLFIMIKDVFQLLM